MDISRRRFFAGHKSKASPLRPPWSLSEALFTDLCTRCNECVKICPTDLLVRGDDGFPIPDFMRGQCTFCGDCARACLPAAISSDLTQPPWFFSIKISEECLAAQNVECRVCGEMCEANVIRFKPRIGGVPLPEVDHASCTGCGACIAPCPVVAVQRVTTHPALELS